MIKVATVVMISEDTQPTLAIETLAGVYLFKEDLKLVGAHVSEI
jgi:hypothetical protein